MTATIGTDLDEGNGTGVDSALGEPAPIVSAGPAPAVVAAFTGGPSWTARARAVAHTPAPDQATLISARADTWLVGGASLAVLAIIVAAERLQSAVPSITSHLGEVATFAALASLAVNYPHFMASYTVAYGRGRDYIATRWIALLVVPGVLAAVLATGVATLGATITIADTTITDLGEHILGVCAQVMFIAVGWHYAKQAYGCALAQAHLRGFALSAAQARALKLSMVPMWVSLWLASNASVGSLSYYGLSYASLALPSWTIPAVNVAVALGALVAVGSFTRAGVANGCRPPAVAVVPVTAMFIWWIPASRNATFVLLVPFFHSLQYLPFAAAVQRNRHAARAAAGRRTWPLGVLGAAVVAAGWVSFEAVPGALDHRWPAGGGVAVYVLAVTLFINIHHYVIDHVAWRLSEPLPRRELFGEPATVEAAS
jgi:hypothetical protein